MTTETEIDIEILISLVEAKPVLWDKTLEIYKDKNETKKAWKEICIAFKPDFEELSDNEKNSFGKNVMKKWGNIRDSFLKSQKKQKEAARSGAGASNIKKYVYSDQLQFLRRICIERMTHDSLATEEENSQNKQNVEQSEQIPESGDKQNADRFRLPQHAAGSRKRKADDVELKMLKMLERPDRHLSFFQGIIPSLLSFDEDDIVQFQIGVLQLISNIKKQKQVQPATIHTQHLPDHSSRYLNPVVNHQTLLPATGQSYQPTYSQYPNTSQQMQPSSNQLYHSKDLYICTQPIYSPSNNSQQFTSSVYSPLNSPQESATPSIHNLSPSPSPAYSTNSSTLESIDFNL